MKFRSRYCGKDDGSFPQLNLPPRNFIFGRSQSDTLPFDIKEEFQNKRVQMSRTEKGQPCLDLKNCDSHTILQADKYQYGFRERSMFFPVSDQGFPSGKPIFCQIFPKRLERNLVYKRGIRYPLKISADWLYFSSLVIQLKPI